MSDKEEEKDMAKVLEKNNNTTTLNLNYLNTAKRLPVKDGKIILDRKDSEHVKWAEGYEVIISG